MSSKPIGKIGSYKVASFGDVRLDVNAVGPLFVSNNAIVFGRNPPFKQRPVFALTRYDAGGLPVPQTPWDVLSIAAPG